MQFVSLEQRMIKTYIDTFPPFVPTTTGEVTHYQQEQFWTFIHSVYKHIFNHPEILFPQINEDDAYQHYFNKSADKKPELIKLMKKDIKIIEDLLLCLFTLGRESDLHDGALKLHDSYKLTKKQAVILQQLDLSVEGNQITHHQYRDMFAAWQWLATRNGASLFEFSRCMFDKEHAYAPTIIAALSGDATAFCTLENYLLRHGYVRTVTYNNCINLGFCTNNPIILNYVKKHGDTDKEPGNFVYDHHYTGISVEYSLIMHKPIFFGLRILGMKELLLKFNAMPEILRDFIVARTKQCDMCGYCNFKKWETRKPAAVSVSHHGEHALCPIFPGYNYCFNELDASLVGNIIAFLSFMDMEPADT